MASLNKVFLIGNLTRDPEVRYTPSGAAVGDLGLATSRKYKSSDGESKEEKCFVNVTVWGRQAETCAEYLKKGRPVMVEGRLKYDDWEKDGKKFSKLSVTAERVQFLGSRDSGGSGGGSHGGQTEDVGGAPAGNASAGDDENLPF